jgi:hypothetical protein
MTTLGRRRKTWIVKLALNRPYTFGVAAILILFLGFTSIATTFSHDRPYAARRCELDIYVHFNTQELATSMLACAVRVSHLDPDYMTLMISPGEDTTMHIAP